jgi:hypothetical protein
LSIFKWMLEAMRLRVAIAEIRRRIDLPVEIRSIMLQAYVCWRTPLQTNGWPKLALSRRSSGATGRSARHPKADLEVSEYPNGRLIAVTGLGAAGRGWTGRDPERRCGLIVLKTALSPNATSASPAMAGRFAPQGRRRTVPAPFPKAAILSGSASEADLSTA